MKEKKKTPERKIPSYKPLMIFFLLCPFLIGLYYEWLSCLATVFLVGYLVYCRVYSGELLVPKTLTMAACCIVVIFFAASPLWAVDKGMAVLGLMKFLPLPLFCMAAAQITREQRQKLIDTIPLSGAVMVPLSAALCLIPICRDYIIVNQRLGGFFQYPNTFAIFLLVGIVIQLYGKPISIRSAVICLILLSGIFASGSRTVFILMAGSLIVYLIAAKNKRRKLILIAVMGIALIGTIGYVLISGNLDTVGRYLTSSLTSSTFVGRLLYYYDALPVILKHPLGLGYMGYYYTQGSFQTGVYAVVNIHNELLQILLDIGWIPTAACVAALVAALKKSSGLCRLIIILIVAHSMLDFDLQFLSVAFILVLAAECANEKQLSVKNIEVTSLTGLAAAGFSVYFCIASAAYYFNFYDITTAVYPAYTMAYVQKLSQAKTTAESEAIADRIISLNQSAYIAYSAKGRAAFSTGDILQMIEYKKKAISLERYSMTEYEDYYSLLEMAAGLYEEAGDDASAEYCRRCMKEIGGMIDQVLKETSALGWMIDVTPVMKWEH